MAGVTDTGGMGYFLNGEPIVGGSSGTDTGSMTYFLNGEPMLTIFPIELKSFGQFFLMF